MQPDDESPHHDHSGQNSAERQNQDGSQSEHLSTQAEAERPPTNGLAIASLVLGILWIFWLGSILAVVFGHVALGQIRRSKQSGRGLAIAGLTLGWLGLGLLIPIVLAA